MKVLIISANKFPFSPCGPAYIEGAARDIGHTVKIFDCLFSENPASELKQDLLKFNPDVVGISIRTVAGKLRERKPPFDTILFDNRKLVKEVTDCIKQCSSASIILGGPGFNYYGEEWLNYLNIDYGLRGECEHTFPQYLKQLEQNKPIPK